MKSDELSPAACQALGEMSEDYGFTYDEKLLDDVLDVLAQLTDLTHEERQLRRELEAMPPVARESLSRAVRGGLAK